MNEVPLTSTVGADVLGAASSALEAVSPEQIQLAEATEEQPLEMQVQQSNGHNSTLQLKIDTHFSAGEAPEQLQSQARTSSAADTGYESVATSMQSLDISSDGTESAVEQSATLEAQTEQPQQQEWICLSTPDGYWYWLNTVTGVSQWVEAQELQEPAINWLHKYAVAGSVQEVQQVLSSEGVDVNGTNEQGQTALHLVCGLRYPSQQTLMIAEMLLRFGADVNAQDSGGHTPLHAIATTSGAPSFISLLLAYGARPYVINSQGHTPLQSAALASNYDAMQTILQFTKSAEASKEHRIQLPQRVASQTTDAQPQAETVHTQWERYWTSEGIPYVVNKATGESKWDTDETSDATTAFSQNGNSVSDARHTHGNLRPVKLRGNREELDRHLQVWSRFFENAFRQRHQFDTPPDIPHMLKPVRATKKRRQLALWPELPSDDEYAKAVQLSWQPSAGSLAEQSASMRMAAMTNDADTVRRFLQAGVSPNATDEMLRSAAHHAAHHDCIDVLVLLQDFGADLDLVDADVNTPLHVASMRGHTEVVTFLLESAVDVNIQNKNGDTALHLAVKQRQLAVCRQLLEYGADQTLRNNAGYTAQDTASLVAPHQQHMSMTSLFARGENTAATDNRHPHGAARVGKTWSSADLRLQIPKQGLPTQDGGGGRRAPPNSVRDSRRQRRREGHDDNSSDEYGTGSSAEEDEESTSSGSNGSASWSLGSFLYRTTLRLVGINNEHNKTKRSSKHDDGSNDEEDDDNAQRRSASPTDAELAAMRTRLPLSSPPVEVIQDIRQKAEEIQRNTPRGREAACPHVQPPAEVVLAYDMAKAAVRNSATSAPPASPPTPAGGPPANIYSLASVPPAERRHYIDVFDARRNTNDSDQEGRLH